MLRDNEAIYDPVEYAIGCGQFELTTQKPALKSANAADRHKEDLRGCRAQPSLR